MGVAGSGKTTIGRLLSNQLGWPFYDGDDFHPVANREKMAKGEPLTDKDRAPWLAALARLVVELDHAGRSAVVACSALKKSYRDTLEKNIADLRFVYLKGSYDLFHERLLARQEHFMKAKLLGSQFEILEEPADAVIIDARQEPDRIAARIRQVLNL